MKDDIVYLPLLNERLQSQDLYRLGPQFSGSEDHHVLRMAGQSQTQDGISNKKKDMAIDTYFKDRIFSGHKEQSLNETLVDFDICPRMFRLNY